jgi:hypothetical protein
MEAMTLDSVFSRMTGDELTVVLIIGTIAVVGGIVFLTRIIVSAVQRHHGRMVASSVVAEMLDRGMAPQDIVAILKAMGLEDPPDRSNVLIHSWQQKHQEARK